MEKALLLVILLLAVSSTAVASCQHIETGRAQVTTPNADEYPGLPPQPPPQPGPLKKAASYAIGILEYPGLPPQPPPQPGPLGGGE